MRKLYIILAIILFTAVSCVEHRTIPRKKLARIYYEMYLTDEAISSDRHLRRMTDSLHLYEPIFNKYGYTSDDYRYTVEVYLENPEKYRKIFDRTKAMLEKKRDELQEIYISETYFDRMKRWRLLDTLDHIVNAEGKGLGFHTWAQFFFSQIDPKPMKDTLRYDFKAPRWFLDTTSVAAIGSRKEYSHRPDSLRLDSLQLDSLRLDSLRIDSLLRDTLYIPYPLRVNFIITDSVTIDSAAIDSLAAHQSAIDTMPNPFARVHIFAEHFTIGTTAADAPFHSADTAFVMTPTVLADTTALKDTTAFADSAVTDSVRPAAPTHYDPYGSYIVNFILNDSAYFDAAPYVYAPDTLIVKHMSKNSPVPNTGSKSWSASKPDQPAKKDLFNNSFDNKSRIELGTQPDRRQQMEPKRSSTKKSDSKKSGSKRSGSDKSASKSKKSGQNVSEKQKGKADDNVTRRDNSLDSRRGRHMTAKERDSLRRGNAPKTRREITREEERRQQEMDKALRSEEERERDRKYERSRQEQDRQKTRTKKQ